MTSMSMFSDIPDWGKPFVEPVHQYLFHLIGQSQDVDFIECTVHYTFTLAQHQLKGLTAEAQQEKLIRAWILQLAEEAFIRHLLRQLSVDPALYFEIMYIAFHQKVRLRIAALLKKAENDQDVEDCVQDTFMKVFHILESRVRVGAPMPVYPFVGWLYSVAWSVCHDYWEKQNQRNATFSLEEQTTLVEQMSENEQELPEIYAEIKEREAKVRACVDRLPEPCRSCMKLFYYSDLAIAEIATTQKLTPGQVKTCIYQLGVRRFRKLWSEENDE